MSVFVIKVNGVDITGDIVLSDAMFNSQASGSVGTCNLRVRDLSKEYQFIVGQEITLDIDGRRMWGGYVSAVKRKFFFPVQDTETRRNCEPTAVVPRALIIEGVDYNILFRRRFCYDQADPTNTDLRSYPAGTHDDVQIRNLCEDYLDLSGDGIDFVSKVEHVGTPNPDLRGNPAGIGYSWGQAMHSIAMLTGAVWYIDPDKALVYTDVDTPNADFGLSDNPGIGQLGYRDMDIEFNGTQLRNDAMVWGVGQGSAFAKFERIEDATSIAEHGRWQVGDYRQDMYRQESVTRRARSFVYGSPQNKRGGKDDAVSVQCALFEPAFRVAEKVDFESDVFGFTDVIPIRRERITFIGPTEARYDLVLSHYIDEPWNIHEFWFPPLNFVIPSWPIIDLDLNVDDPFCPVERQLMLGVPVGSDNFNRDDNEAFPLKSPNGCITYNFAPNIIDGHMVLSNGGFNIMRIAYPTSGPTQVVMAFDNSHWTSGVPTTEIQSSQLTWAASWDGDGNVALQALGLEWRTIGNGTVVGEPIGARNVNSIASDVATTTVSTDLIRSPIYVRVTDFGDGQVTLAIWKQSEVEPGLPQLVSSGTFPGDPLDELIGPVSAPLYYFSVSHTGASTTTKMRAYTIYGTGSAASSYGIRGSDENAFSAIWNLPPPDDGGTYIGWSSSFNYSAVKTSTAGSAVPTTDFTFGNSQFAPFTGNHLKIVDEDSVSWDLTGAGSFSGAPTDAVVQRVRITGEATTQLSGIGLIGEPFQGGKAPPTMVLEFVTYDHGTTGNPYLYPHQMLGRVRDGVSVPGKGNSPAAEPLVWVPFGFDVPGSDIVENRLQWGIRFRDPEAYAGEMPNMGGGIALPRTRQVFGALRKVRVDVFYAPVPCGALWCTPPTAWGGTQETKVCDQVTILQDLGEAPIELSTSQPYQIGTLEVFMDGLGLVRGSDYIELDPAEGTYQIQNSVADVLQIRTCYYPVTQTVTPTPEPTP